MNKNLMLNHENITFHTQKNEINIELLNREKNIDKKNFILAVVYGKDYENTFHMVSKKQFDSIIFDNKLSEYDLKSCIFTININDKKYKAVIRQIQRQTMASLNNKLSLIHLDFMIVSDEKEFEHYITTYITNTASSQDYKNGAVLHLKRHIKHLKKANESLNDLPIRAHIDFINLSKSNSISINNQCIVSLTKR